MRLLDSADVVDVGEKCWTSITVLRNCMVGRDDGVWGCGRVGTSRGGGNSEEQTRSWPGGSGG